MQTHHYSTQIIRISTSLIVSIFMTLHGRWHEIGRALITPTFYFSVFISFWIAYLLMYFVHSANTLLDRKHSINNHLVRRVVLQIGVGILAPALLDVLLMYFYFKVLGRDIFKTTYLLVDFPIVLILLLFLNVFYLMISSFGVRKKTSQNVQDEVLVIDYNGIHVKLNLTTDILFFYRDRKLIKVHTTSGKEYSLKDTIGNLNERYCGDNFCQVNPSAIVNIYAVKGYTAGTTRDTLQMLFKAEYQSLLRSGDLKLLRVTKDHIEKFKYKLDHLTDL